MGIQIKGSNDTISASDGSMVLEGSALTFDNESITGISTMATGHITGTATIDDDLKVGISTLFVDKSAGRVGIGTDNPQVRLTVSSDSPAVMDVHHVDGGTNDEARIILGALALNPPSNRGAGIAAVNNGAGHDLIIKCSASHAAGPTEKLRVKSGGQVLIGTETEGHADADDLTIRTSSRTGMTIRSADDDYGNIFFSDATSGTGEYVGKVQYYHADNTMRFGTSSADKLIINSAGDVNISGVTTATQFLPTEVQTTNRNMVINGDMQVSQRGTQVTGLTASAYATVDRFKFIGSAGGTYTCDTVSDSVDNGLRKAFKFTCTTADNAGQNNLANADGLIGCEYRFEGQDVQRIQKGFSSAKQVTLSFWVKSNLTGTYNVEIKDTDNSRNCGFNYTVSSSGTWEKKIITFPADTTGTMDNDNNQSLTIQWWLAAGNNYRTGGSAQTTWGSTTKNKRAYNNVSLSKATSNYWQITGVQLEVGAAATPFEHRSFNEQLDMCQRYYQLYRNGTNKSLGLAFGYATGEVDMPVNFIKQMRTDATLVQGSGSNYYQLQGGVGSGVFVDGAWVLQLAGEQGGNMYSTNLSGTLTVGSAYHARQVNSSAYVHFNAEL